MRSDNSCCTGFSYTMRGENKMKLHTLSGGDEVHRFDRCIVVSFSGKRKVLSTAPFNGGYREDLTAALNHDGNYGRGCAVQMKADTYGEHMQVTLREIGLPEETTAGLETAAQMENASIITETFRDLSVTAIVTGGIEASGGRAGDPADWYEYNRHQEAKDEAAPAGTDGHASESMPKPGTINMILHIGADLYEGTMARALVTATEAKTAALQELLAPGVNSRGIATGSGTDGTIIIANAEADLYLTDAGKFSKLGELIGKAVNKAVKEALYKQNGLCAKSQHHILRRMERFGTSEGQIYRRMVVEEGEVMPRYLFSDKLDALAASGDTVAYVSCIAHILDQLDWGLLDDSDAVHAVNGIFSLLEYEGELASGKEKEDLIRDIVDHFERMVIRKIANHNRRG